MDRIEPRQDTDWHSLSFRRPSFASPSGQDPRFAIGVAIFLAVALAYPWYSYWVSTYLLGRDLKAATTQFQAESDKADAQLSASMARTRESNAADAQAAAEYEQRRQVAAVRVLGVSTGGAKPLVLVNLGNASLTDADEEVCRQASSWMRRELSGVTIRIHRFRGNQPAVDAGEVVCP